MSTREHPTKLVLDSLPTKLLLIGVDHNSAPISLRERVAYDEHAAAEVMCELSASAAIDEVFLLSTCNRTELVIVTTDDSEAYRLGFEKVFVERAPEIEEQGRFYVKREHEVVRHLYALASGMLSMVLGEPEILGQLKRGAAIAGRNDLSGVLLRELLGGAVSAGGRARRETRISQGSVSFGYAVVDVARSIFQSLGRCSVLLFGAGETTRQVARNLLERGATELIVTNRTLAHAEELCSQFPQARVCPFEDRNEAVSKCDLLVTSLTTDEPILDEEDLRVAMQKRPNRPLLVIDLGVPRNVAPAARSIENLFLQDLDSLQALIALNLKHRREEIPSVQRVLSQEIERFERWRRSMSVEPLVGQLQRSAEALRRREVEAVKNRFPDATHYDLEKMTRALVRKLLHNPSRFLRNQSRDFDAIQLTRDLFALDPSSSEDSE